MAFIKLPSGKLFNREYFNDIVCVSTVLKCTEEIEKITHTKANYIINITFPGSNYVTLAYEDEALANADRNLIENYLIPQRGY